jgi:alpha-tubulin suppressor-like RCC1 family protein
MRQLVYFHFLRGFVLLVALSAFCFSPLLSPASQAADPVSGSLWAWGSNTRGQLGSGTFDSTSIPIPVNGLSGVVKIAAGDTHILALKSDGTVWAWGSNSNGELGNGNKTDSAVPVQVNGLTNVVAVAASGG